MSLVPALFGAGFGLCVLLLVAGLAGQEGGAAPRSRRHPRARPVASGRGAAGVGTGVLFFLLTGWVGGGFLAGLAAFSLPRLLGTRAKRTEAVERTEAVAAWTEMLRADMAGAAGIEEAIEASAKNPPEAIAPEVANLAASIRHQRLEPALRDFADAVADPTADLVVTALVLASRRSTRDLGAALGDLASAAEDDTAMRDQVDTSRTRSRTAVRIVSMVTLLVSGGLVVLGGDYMDPFDSAEGQAVLVVLVGGAFAASLTALARMSEVALLPRVALSVPDEQAGSP